MANQKELAQHLDLTDRQVRYLLADGILPTSRGNGGLNLQHCRLAYCRYLRGLNSGQVKAEAGDLVEDGIDPLVEYHLMIEKVRLTTAQAVAQEKKNEVMEQQLIPVEVATFVLSKVASHIASVLDTVPQKLRRKHPEMDPRHLESLEREIAVARNLAAEVGEKVPEFVDEYFEKYV
ncbi:DNA packaging protein [Pseudomonas frederiksbergensis]|uniref:DNA packaging protein n=1 Tax=Pseudomonas frederiksbergensis TaxID=104087 RepID=A0A423K9I8_9PSED|nr:terminase small subunit [Pseudomonas frederiksbergensis]RON48569.1 DNA packaging protein [Pseudomonas frederiksbergensis]